MTERLVVLEEAEPGIVNVQVEAMHNLLLLAGFRHIEGLTYSKRDEHEARKPHPATMAGRP